MWNPSFSMLLRQKGKACFFYSSKQHGRKGIHSGLECTWFSYRVDFSSFEFLKPTRAQRKSGLGKAKLPSKNSLREDITVKKFEILRLCVHNSILAKEYEKKCVDILFINIGGYGGDDVSDSWVR